MSSESRMLMLNTFKNILLILLVFLLLLSLEKNQTTVTKNILKIDTITKTDTIHELDTVFVVEKLKIPIPTIDTIITYKKIGKIKRDTFRTYFDTLKLDYLSLAYQAKVRGELKSMKMEILKIYKQKTILKNTERTVILNNTKNNALFIGLSAGNEISASAFYRRKKVLFGYSYSPIQQKNMFTIAYKLF